MGHLNPNGLDCDRWLSRRDKAATVFIGLTAKRGMLEIEQDCEIDDLKDLEIWKRECQHPVSRNASAILEAHGKRRVTGAPWSLMPLLPQSFEPEFCTEVAA